MSAEAHNSIVTGATSMLGIATIEALLLQSRGDAVFAVVRPGSERVAGLPHDRRLRLVECDAGDYAALPEKLGDACAGGTFYHFAWTGTSSRNADVLGQARNVAYAVEAVRAASLLGCSAFVGAGSQAEYGLIDGSRPIGPDDPADPDTPYGVAKYAAGRLVLEEASRLGLHAAWVRVFSVYGPHDRPETMVSQAMNRLADGAPTAFTEAVQPWDYLYSADAGEAFAALGGSVRGRRTYCLGSGEARPLREYILEMRDVLRPGLPDNQLGIGLVGHEGPARGTWADISALTADTGWTPTTSFAEGIRRTYRAGKH